MYIHLLLTLVDLVYSIHMLTLLNDRHTNQTTTFVWSLLHALRTSLLSTLRQQKSKDLLEATIRETGRLYTNYLLLRKITVTQNIMGHRVPKGTVVACSPLVTARDPNLFPDPDKFQPERWLIGSELDENHIKRVHRSGASNQFGKGQHACKGEKLG